MPHDSPNSGRGGSDDGGSGSPPRWLQRGGFSVFFDVLVDDLAGEIWRTRIYHDETSQETVVAGVGAAQWSRWILGRLGASRTDPDGPDLEAPIGPDTTVHQVIVEVVDVRLIGRIRQSRDVESVRVEAELRIGGLAALERGLGAAVVDRGIGRPAT